MYTTGKMQTYVDRSRLVNVCELVVPSEMEWLGPSQDLVPELQPEVVYSRRTLWDTTPPDAGVQRTVMLFPLLVAVTLSDARNPRKVNVSGVLHSLSVPDLVYLPRAV